MKFLIEKKTCGRILVPAVWPREKNWVCLLFIHGWLVILQARLLTQVPSPCEVAVLVRFGGGGEGGGHSDYV